MRLISSILIYICVSCGLTTEDEEPKPWIAVQVEKTLYFEPDENLVGSYACEDTRTTLLPVYFLDVGAKTCEVISFKSIDETTTEYSFDTPVTVTIGPGNQRTLNGETLYCYSLNEENVGVGTEKDGSVAGGGAGSAILTSEKLTSTNQLSSSNVKYMFSYSDEHCEMSLDAF